jgi:hypothetical protein
MNFRNCISTLLLLGTIMRVFSSTTIRIVVFSQAGETKQGTDEEKFIETLTSRSNVHLIEMYKEYEKVQYNNYSDCIYIINSWVSLRHFAVNLTGGQPKMY